MGGAPGPGSGAPVAFAPAAAKLRRLTGAEYRNAVQDLLGVSPPSLQDLEPDAVIAGFTSVAASQTTISETAAEHYEKAALDAAAAAFVDDARRRALVGCAPTSVDDPCVAAFLGRFGRRAFRRPLEVTELGQYRDLARAVAQQLGDPWKGLEYAVAGLLESPFFLYRVELGEVDPDAPGRLRYTSREMAGRLAFLLWQTIPDPALQDAGDSGELVTRSGIGKQAGRLLVSDRARPALMRFFNEYLRLDSMAGMTKDAASFPAFTPELRLSMQTEITMSVADLVFRRGDMRDLLDNRATFLNGSLARLYGLSSPTGAAFEKVILPADGPRAGLLGYAGILSLHARPSRTSPTLRGKYIRESILCQAIPPPPPNANTTLPGVAANQGPRTVRQQLEEHRKSAACASCHLLMDSVGVTLETFDGIGAYRATDQGAPIDASGELDGQPFDGPRGLVPLLKGHRDLVPCLVSHVYAYSVGRPAEMSERPVLDGLETSFASARYDFISLISALVQSDGFRFAAKSP